MPSHKRYTSEHALKLKARMINHCHQASLVHRSPQLTFTIIHSWRRTRKAWKHSSCEWHQVDVGWVGPNCQNTALDHLFQRQGFIQRGGPGIPPQPQFFLPRNLEIEYGYYIRSLHVYIPLWGANCTPQAAVGGSGIVHPHRQEKELNWQNNHHMTYSFHKWHNMHNCMHMSCTHLVVRPKDNV